MMHLGLIRIVTPDALSFAREKLRACLVVAGLRHVLAGQITTVVSQAVRDRLPAELKVLLEDGGRHIALRPVEIAGPYQRIQLLRPPDAAGIDAMQAILNRLTREELLSDLEHQVQERTADLERERERSERLLRNMLPEVIARRMKDGEAIADTHEATVLFADIKGFTVLASERSAKAVVTILDRIFREFDAIAQKHGLEKIKTIGDSYMAAAGLPVPQLDHVDRAVLMGLDMVAAMPRLRDELGLSIDVRIGVHTGPVVAGVIGTQKHAYDIWGDTVNVASRMESHGEPGRLQVSDEVRQALGMRYHLEERGMIEIKNHDSRRTWFVLGIAPLGSGLKTMATSVRGEPVRDASLSP
jgi:class 3 adenylate cyclase